MSTDARPTALLSTAERRGMLRDAVAVLSSSHLATVCGVIQNLIVLAAIPPRLMGMWTVVRTLLDYGSYSSLGANRAAGIELAVAGGSGDPVQVRRVRDAAMTIELAAASLIALGMGAAGMYCLMRRDWTWGGLLLAGAAASVIGRYHAFSLTVLRSFKQFPQIAQARVFGAVLELALYTGGAYCFGFTGLLIAWVLAHAANAWFVRSRGGLRFDASFDRDATRRLLGLGAPLAAEAFALSGLRSVDRLVIAWCVWNGPEQLGWYRIAMMFGAWTFDQSHLIANVVFPRLGESFGRTREAEPVLRLAARSAEWIARALVLVAAGLLVAGVPLVAHLLPDYRPGLAATSGLVAAAALLGISMPLRHALLTVARTGSMLAVTALAWMATLAGGVIILSGTSDQSGAALGWVAWNSAAAAGLLLALTLLLSAWAHPRLRGDAWRVALHAGYLAAGIATLGALRGQCLEQSLFALLWCLWPGLRLVNQFRSHDFTPTSGDSE